MRSQPHFVEALASVGPFGVVACGSAHTLVATELGTVYGFGWNEHGQVHGQNCSYALDNGDTMGGHEKTSKNEGVSRDESGLSDFLLPVVCLEKKGIVKLSCGLAHSAAISSNGNLYTWGRLSVHRENIESKIAINYRGRSD